MTRSSIALYAPLAQRDEVNVAMTARLRKKCKTCIVARRVSGCLVPCDRMEQIARELDVMLRDTPDEQIRIEEQLKQCPEAFKAGELMERMFNAVRFGHDAPTEHEKLLPPPGAVMPPLV